MRAGLPGLALLLAAAALAGFSAALARALRAPGADWVPLAVSAALPFVAGLIALGGALVISLRRTADAAAVAAVVGLLLLGAGWLVEAPAVWSGRATPGRLLQAAGAAWAVAACADLLGGRRGLAVALASGAGAIIGIAAGGGSAGALALGAVACGWGGAGAAALTPRRQAVWVTAGAGAGALAGLLGLTVGGPAGQALAALGDAAFALALVAATLKLRLLDADALIGGAALDLLAGGVLAGAGWALNAGGDAAAPGLGAVLGGVGVATGLLGWRLIRGRCAARLLRAARPRAAAAETRLAALPDALTAAADATAAAARLRAEVMETLGVRDATYLVHEGHGVLRPLATEPVRAHRISPQGRLLTLLAAYEAPVPAEALRAAPLTLQEQAVVGDAALVVPCTRGAALVGVLRVGPRVDGGPPDGAAYRLLARLSGPLGATLDPQWWADRLARSLATERALGRAHRAEVLNAAAREVERAAHPALAALRRRARADDADARDAADALDALLGDVAHAEVGVVTVPFDLGALLAEVATVLAAEADARQVVLAVVDPGGAAHALGDAAAIRLALVLLVRDALGALGDWSGPRQITVGLRGGRGRWHVWVSDTGPGRALPPPSAWAAPGPASLHALVARVAARHGSPLTCDLPVDAGRRLGFTVPRADDPHAIV